MHTLFTLHCLLYFKSQLSEYTPSFCASNAKYNKIQSQFHSQAHPLNFRAAGGRAQGQSC